MAIKHKLKGMIYSPAPSLSYQCHIAAEHLKVKPKSAIDLWTKCMLVSFFVSPGVGLFVDNVFREDKCKSLAIVVTGITVCVLVICLASLVKGSSFAIRVY